MDTRGKASKKRCRKTLTPQQTKDRYDKMTKKKHQKQGQRRLDTLLQPMAHHGLQVSVTRWHRT